MNDLPVSANKFLGLIRQQTRYWRHAILLFCLVLMILSGMYLLSGEVFISPLHWPSVFQWQLLLELRLPRLLIAMVIGASLASSGATLQVLLNNPLAEPGIVGVSGGASVAMVLVLFCFPQLQSPAIFMVCAIIGAMLFTLLLITVARVMKLSTSRLLLIGVALGILASSVVTWAFYFSDDLNLRLLMYWLMGGISGAAWNQFWLVAAMVPVMVWLALQGRVMDKLMLGEVQSMQLGVDIHRVRWRLILALSVLVGGSVALGGMIGFVGLIVPHLIRIAVGSENRYLLPLSMVAGATLLVGADLIARLALDASELPLGVVTTTIGAPVFIWLLLRNHDLR